ncbi:MAG TPA: cytochrome c oxidase subunit II [Thermomicrobiales bacterium]|nr:cytochrome c oxidase subunit II [Thermomicrobiales bacterium]
MSGARRAFASGGAAVAAVSLLAGCGVDQPYSTIAPQSDRANDIQWLYSIVFWASLVVFVLVQAAIVYTIVRFRRRSEDERPEQIHGSKRLEIAWTILPAVILLVIFIPTAQIIYKHAAAAGTANFQVDVLAKQWWWEFTYPNIPVDPNNAQAGPIITANEVYVPQGADVVFNLQSNNVIHSFWVPQLSGKLDVMPGHVNQLEFTADKVGDYFGECAEFCGASHAWMRFKVKVVPQAEFDAWVNDWRTPPQYDGNPATKDVHEVPAAFGVCLVCHNINGTNAKIAKSGLGSNPDGIGAAPNLTMLGCRDTIGAGILLNNEQDIETWLKHTDEVKAGVYMPNYYKAGQINDQQVAALAKYLTSLKPPGGCPQPGPVGGVIAPAATPAP